MKDIMASAHNLLSHSADFRLPVIEANSFSMELFKNNYFLSLKSINLLMYFSHQFLEALF